MIKIMHILGNFGPGGAEMGVVRLINAMQGEKIQHLVCSIGSNVALKGLLPEGTYCHSLNVHGASYSAVISLCRLLRKTKTDIAHVNNLAPWFDVALASKLAGCKCIETFHGVEDSITHFPFYKKTQLKMASALTPAITSVAISAKELLMNVSGIKESRIKVIPNGIDTDYFKPLKDKEKKYEERKNLNLPEKGILLGCVAALRPVKDQEGLIKAFTEYLRSHNKETYLILVGDGILAGELKALSEKLMVKKKVIFMGQQKEINKILQTLDIFVLNSRTEGMSYAILEAMASGLPIIATNVGGNSELIKNGEEGFLYSHGDKKSLSEYMAKLYENEHLLAEMGKKARKRVVESYSLSKMISSYENLYFELLKRK